MLRKANQDPMEIVETFEEQIIQIKEVMTKLIKIVKNNSNLNPEVSQKFLEEIN